MPTTISADRAGGEKNIDVCPEFHVFIPLLKCQIQKIFLFSLFAYLFYLLSFLVVVDGGRGSIQKSIAGIASPKLQTQFNPHVAPASRESVICARIVWLFSFFRECAPIREQESWIQQLSHMRSGTIFNTHIYHSFFMQIAFYQTQFSFNAFTFWQFLPPWELIHVRINMWLFIWLSAAAAAAALVGISFAFMKVVCWSAIVCSSFIGNECERAQPFHEYKMAYYFFFWIFSRLDFVAR